MIKVVQYINQFFAQIGGEEMAHVKPELREGIVFIPFLKGLKYAEAYKKNLSPEKTKYQVVTASKKERAEYVQKKLKYAGLNLSYNYVRKHLAEI